MRKVRRERMRRTTLVSRVTSAKKKNSISVSTHDTIGDGVSGGVIEVSIANIYKSFPS